MSRRHIILTKQWPVATGGGLGVARQFFLGLAEIGVAGRDIWAICGNDVMPVRDADTCRHIADSVPSRPPASRIFTTFQQLRAICRLSVQDTTLIAFTPFYAWPVTRMICPGLRLVHVEQSKGGRHYELASFHGTFGLKEQFVRAAVVLNFVFSHKAVFPSRGALDLFCGKNPALASLVRKKAGVINNGIEPLPARSGWESPPVFRILSVCEDVPEKALGDCLRVISLLEKAGCAVTCEHFGTVRDSTRHLAESQGIPVVFHGLRPRADVVAAMQRADVFLHLPRVAVFDLVLIEAMSAGLPVIASPTGGNLEALGDGIFADSPEAAAQNIQNLMKDPERAGRIGQELRARAGRLFSSAIMTGRYLEI